MTGYDIGDMDMCDRTNATYESCPIQKMMEKAGSAGKFNMTVAIHNPSNIEMQKVEILVPDGTYRAIAYNISSGIM